MMLLSLFRATVLLFSLDPQTPSRPALAFEVATVKLSTTGANGVSGGCHGVDSIDNTSLPLGRCIISDGRLSHLVGIAWGVEMQLLKSNADWIRRGTERFTLEAKADDPATATEAQLHQMLQALLIERFELKYHLEPVTLPGFALTVAKGGPRLKESASGETEFTLRRKGAAEDRQDAGVKRSAGRGGADGGSARKPSGAMLQARHYTMEQLAHALSVSSRGGQVVNRTGLSGFYDLTLKWDNNLGPSLEDAVREQLGLRMEREKSVPVNYFVIDSAKRPVDN